MFRLRWVLPIFVCMFLFTIMGWTSSYASDEVGNYVTVIVANESKSVKEGDVITKGVLNEDGHCSFPQIEVSHESNSAFVEVVFSTDRMCHLTVSLIDQKTTYISPQAPPSEGEFEQPSLQNRGDDGNQDLAPLGAGVPMWGWARNTFREQFGIAVTLTHSDMTYLDDGSKVWNGAIANPYCWWVKGTGWWLEKCLAWHSFSGPNEVWLDVLGEYDHPFGINHTTTAKFIARPGGWWNPVCTFVGVIPPLWKWSCSGGRQVW